MAKVLLATSTSPPWKVMTPRGRSGSRPGGAADLGESRAHERRGPEAREPQPPERPPQHVVRGRSPTEPVPYRQTVADLARHAEELVQRLGEWTDRDAALDFAQLGG